MRERRERDKEKQQRAREREKGAMTPLYKSTLYYVVYAHSNDNEDGIYLVAYHSSIIPIVASGAVSIVVAVL
jgi:hypothetical protein